MAINLKLYDTTLTFLFRNRNAVKQFVFSGRLFKAIPCGFANGPRDLASLRVSYFFFPL